MNNKAKYIRIWIAAALAMVFAGSGLSTIATAMDHPAAGPIYAAAALSSALCGLAAGSAIGAVAAALLLALIAGGWTVTHLTALRAMRAFFSVWQGLEADPQRAALGGRAFLVCAALAFGALFFILLYRRELSSLAIMILLAVLISSHAMSESAGIGASLPGLIACAFAFALNGGVQRDAASLRALLPAALAAAVALMLMPAGRVTWQPLEDAAERVRSVFEQYFNFTHERIAFSISEEGYNHGGELDGEAVAMLGGPAQPDPEPVMRVRATDEVLLRGTIRSTYTGYSWVDVAPKSRYLYFDLTHRGVRDRVFNLDLDSPADAFSAVEADVEFLDGGTSTLFVPARLDRFSMDLSNAVYYNSSGEMFMARQVAPGDAYRLRALLPVYGEGLRQAVQRGEIAGDDQYAGLLASNTALPPVVEDALYALTVDIIRDARSAYDRADAIANYLRRSMRYSLDVDYPPTGRDFVSWFVLESRTGYCSYFASAMAVMGRIAGLPTRYVEGYLARPDAGGEATLTGEDAHAWAEVYFQGVGWVPFDPTNGGPARGDGEPGDGAGDGGGERDDSGERADALPDVGSESDDLAGTSPTPDPGEPEPEDGGSDDGADDNADDNTDSESDGGDAEPPEPEDGGSHSRAWLWALLILLALLAAALGVRWVRGRLRRADPAYLCGQTRSAQQAAMIAYRANLTLLGHMGQGPVNGETPEAFVARVAKQFDNPDYEQFVRAVSLNRYARQPLRSQDIQAGLRAYRAFEGRLRRVERLRFGVARVLHGLGDFESIP